MVKTFFLLSFLILILFQVSSSFAQPDRGIGIDEVPLIQLSLGPVLQEGFMLSPPLVRP